MCSHIPLPRSVKITSSWFSSAIVLRAFSSSCFTKRVVYSKFPLSRAVQIIPAEVNPSASMWDTTCTDLCFLISSAHLPASFLNVSMISVISFSRILCQLRFNIFLPAIFPSPFFRIYYVIFSVPFYFRKVSDFIQCEFELL
ncbi:hypothetical protein SDC9_139892 [bioreactor metagenome]|uniref:Uncharacterized protein n=1 Tax=bioreactor metagenome TaxID=1076179 RepID=A0A645DTU3_9ZZZZ